MALAEHIISQVNRRNLTPEILITGPGRFCQFGYADVGFVV